MSLLECQTSLKFRLRVVGEPWSLILAMKIEQLIFQSNMAVMQSCEGFTHYLKEVWQACRFLTFQGGSLAIVVTK
jgi:hypothetical protein